MKQSITRNENYLERVVEALEALQDAVLAQPDEQPETETVEMAC
jgi:hypothetical protein